MKSRAAANWVWLWQRQEINGGGNLSTYFKGGEGRWTFQCHLKGKGAQTLEKLVPFLLTLCQSFM